MIGQKQGTQNPASVPSAEAPGGMRAKCQFEAREDVTPPITCYRHQSAPRARKVPQQAQLLPVGKAPMSVCGIDWRQCTFALHLLLHFPMTTHITHDRKWAVTPHTYKEIIQF